MRFLYFSPGCVVLLQSCGGDEHCPLWWLFFARFSQQALGKEPARVGEVLLQVYRVLLALAAVGLRVPVRNAVNPEACKHGSNGKVCLCSRFSRAFRFDLKTRILFGAKQTITPRLSRAALCLLMLLQLPPFLKRALCWLRSLRLTRVRAERSRTAPPTQVRAARGRDPLAALQVFRAARRCAKYLTSIAAVALRLGVARFIAASIVILVITASGPAESSWNLRALDAFTATTRFSAFVI